MAYRVEVGPKARTQLRELDAAVEAAVERKIIWLAQNAASMVHRRLVGMPDDLAGLCKLRVGDWRILTGFIMRRKLCVFTEFSTDPKYIVASKALFKGIRSFQPLLDCSVIDKQIEVVNE